MDWMYLAQDGGPVFDTSKWVNELSGSVKGGELLEKVRDYQFIKGENISWSLLPNTCNLSVSCNVATPVIVQTAK
jgi:hypothetical protein